MSEQRNTLLNRSEQILEHSVINKVVKTNTSPKEWKNSLQVIPTYHGDLLRIYFTSECLEPEKQESNRPWDDNSSSKQHNPTIALVSWQRTEQNCLCWVQKKSSGTERDCFASVWSWVLMPSGPHVPKLCNLSPAALLQPWYLVPSSTSSCTIRWLVSAPQEET